MSTEEFNNDYVNGDSAGNDEINDNLIVENTGSVDHSKPQKRKWKFFVFSILGVVILTVAYLIVHFLPAKVISQDINSINGCPELFGVEFGMSLDQASDLIEAEHETFTGSESSEISKNSFIYLKIDAEFELYGLPVKDFYCGFNPSKLNSAMIMFSKDETNFDEVVELYSKIYGKPTSENTWAGTKTTIDIIDGEMLGDEEKKIIVRYMITPNSQYTIFTFDGPEIDPCGFLKENYIFDKQPEYFTKGLTAEEDYDISSNDLFTKYTLYPKFNYMGLIKGYTAIELTVDAKETNIGSFSYVFLLDENNVIDKIEYTKTKLEEAYGQYESCDYLSIVLNGSGVVDLSFDEFKSKISSGTQGIYHIQWDDNGKKVTLGLTIDPEKTYYEGYVAFSD